MRTSGVMMTSDATPLMRIQGCFSRSAAVSRFLGSRVSMRLTQSCGEW